MADTAAGDSAALNEQKLCCVSSGVLSGDDPAAGDHPAPGSCLPDNSNGGPECPQSPPASTDGPKLNGTAAEAVVDSKEEKDDNTAEELTGGPGEDQKTSHEAEKEAQAEENGANEGLKEEPLGPDDVVCDSCIESPRRALKSCLTCLVSYCGAHLRPHLENPKFQNHRLVEPLRDIERRTCESHKWPLELFCSADACCICQDCLTEDHRGHNTVPVVEARRQIEAGLLMSPILFITLHLL